jgi:hypothetical protein
MTDYWQSFCRTNLPIKLTNGDIFLTIWSFKKLPESNGDCGGESLNCGKYYSSNIQGVYLYHAVFKRK